MPSPHAFIHPRDQIMRVMERIYQFRMTTTSGGNISIRDDNGDVWITPARVDKGSLRRDDIVCVHSNGTVTGLHRPSSEYPFHAAIYAARPDLRSLVHAHPVALVAFSICRLVPNVRALHEGASVCGQTGLATYALPGSERLGQHIAASFSAVCDCVVLENHGVVTGGGSLQEAFERFETFEFTAKTIIKASMLGKVRYLSEPQQRTPPAIDAAMDAAMESATSAVMGGRLQAASSHERELRRQLCDFVRRSYRQRLMISTEGAFSARLDASAFLITPHRVDRSTLDVGDIVLVEYDAARPASLRTPEGQTPSSAAVNHAAIYRTHPQVMAIANAYPVNATAFTLVDVPLDTRTIPESYIVLRSPNRVPYGAQFGDGKLLAELQLVERPVTLIDNDGVLVCGTSVLDTFDRLEVLESTAETIINSGRLGPLVSMAQADIEELERAFFPKS